MKNYLTEEDIYERAIDKLGVNRPNMDKIVEIAELLDLAFDEENQMYFEPI